MVNERSLINSKNFEIFVEHIFKKHLNDINTRNKARYNDPLDNYYTNPFKALFFFGQS